MTAITSVNVIGYLPLKSQIEVLKMPKPKRRRFLGQLARKVTSNSKKRVRMQRDLEGRKFEQRKRKRARKMLSRLVRKMKTVRNDGDQAVIGFNDTFAGIIAAKQQHGFVEVVQAKDLARNDKRTKGDRTAPATRRQAKALRQAGFKIKGANGKRTKSPSLKWITDNMNIGQAGAALRYLREKGGEQIKQAWQTVLPPRSFLGATETEVSQYVDSIFKQMTQEIAK